ncbi:HD domain-containing protein [Bacillus sp. AK128]
MHYIFKDPKQIYDPFYQLMTPTFPWEYELFQSRSVKRLKYLSHYGTGSFISAVKHSRFEHTVGVWSIIAHFFPDNHELRIAAILHDIGHLPFSHAVERTLGFNHHLITEEYIKGDEVSSILEKYDFKPERIINLLNEDTPLSHKTAYLSADHLDSFLRDSYMLGKLTKHPSELIKRISFSSHYVETDLEHGVTIMKAILDDHKSFLEPTCLALDALLAKSISLYGSHHDVQLETIQQLTNYELLETLIQSKNKEIDELLDIIMYNPERIVVSKDEFTGAEMVEVKKVYDKTPLVNGLPLTTLLPEAESMLENIRSLKRPYYYSY